MVKYRLITFLVILLLFLDCLYSDVNKISKVFLKYNRDKAIAYASKYWNRINDKDYYNNGSAIVDPFTGQVIDSRDCWYYNKQIPIDNYSYTCGGDCANFISQCLIAGNFDSKLLMLFAHRLVGINSCCKSV